MTNRWSRFRVPAVRIAANAAASKTAAVPCVSSLKVQHSSAYWFRIRRALPAPPSSQRSMAFGKSFVVVLTYASTRSPYVNFLDRDDGDRLGQAFDAGTYRRLTDLRRQYDPDQVLQSRSTPPATVAGRGSLIN
jgi:hypothetical protein